MNEKNNAGSDADFYLASSEGYNLEEPRRCKRLTRLRFKRRDDLLLVRIDPPILTKDFRSEVQKVELVVLATRFQGDTLFPIQKWPVFVHLARLLTDETAVADRIDEGELQEIAWAELYPTEEAAREKRL